MKEIKLEQKTINLKDAGGKDEEVEFDYRTLLLNALSSTDANGLSIEDIEIRLKIRSLLKEAEDSVQLEDSDYEYLRDLVVSQRYVLAHPAVLEYVNAIKNAN